MKAGGPSSTAPWLIAGGGIGGLSAALALARQGLPVTVLEAEPAFAEGGAGIQIGPNGSRLLRRWGLGEALVAKAARPEAIRLHDGLSGRHLASVPLGAAAEARYGAPYFVAERRVLHGLLLGALRREANADIMTGFRVDRVDTSTDGVTAVAESGMTVSGPALIGADGIHSRLRGQLFEAHPTYAGRNAWRATAAPGCAGDGRDVSLWLAPKAHLVHYRCGPGGPMNAVAITTGEPASPGWGTPGDIAELARLFSGWAAEPRRLLERFPAWTRWPLLNLPPLSRWTAGRIALLGDAAHPIMPFLASGAVMALEDAAVLAAEASRGWDDPAGALARYEQRRTTRLARIRAASIRTGEIYHMSGAMRLARNLVLAALPGPRLLARNDWLYSYRADL